MQLVQICHRCPKRATDCEGACACTVDGRDIIEHSNAGECPENRYPSRGLGDTIAKLTTAVGIKPCGGCARRKKLLNRLVPFRDAAD